MLEGESGAGLIVSGVVRALLEAEGRSGLYLVGGAEGERRLAASWLDNLIHKTYEMDRGEEAWITEEENRFEARVAARKNRGVVAHLANRTHLILSPEVPPERLLPLGDVPASSVLDWAGTPDLPNRFKGLCKDAIALGELDAAIEEWVVGRMGSETVPRSSLDREARRELEETLSRGFLRRGRDRVVPKLGSSTPWIDLDI